jgi:hypothetical protein
MPVWPYPPIADRAAAQLWERRAVLSSISPLAALLKADSKLWPSLRRRGRFESISEFAARRGYHFWAIVRKIGSLKRLTFQNYPPLDASGALW